jgi:hypothetical protein
MIWILLKRGNEDCHYIKAEPPCMKGEMQVSFWGLVIMLLWGNFQGLNENG